MSQEINIRNIKFEFDQSLVRILYYRYKAFIVPSIVIAVCFILFITVIIGQLQEVISNKNVVQAQKEKLAILKGNLTLLSALSDENIDKQIRVTTTALPIEKDFGGILNGIGLAASRANVGLGDYEFQVGDLASKTTGGSGLPSLQLTIILKDGIIGTQRFIQELEKTLPIATISTVEISRTNSSLLLLFYYKPQPPIRINNEAPIKTLSSAENDAYNKYATLYTISTTANFVANPLGSQSADLFGL